MIDFEKIKGKELTCFIRSDKTMQVSGKQFSATDDYLILETNETIIFVYTEEIFCVVVNKKAKIFFLFDYTN
jgi:hypothetical protein